MPPQNRTPLRGGADPTTTNETAAAEDAAADPDTDAAADPDADSDANTGKDAAADTDAAAVPDTDDDAAQEAPGTDDAAQAPADTAASDLTGLDLSTLTAEELTALAEENLEGVLENVQTAALGTAMLAAQDASTPVTLAASGSSSVSSIPILQQEIEKAMGALTTLTGRLSVVLSRNSVYEGDVTINAGNRAVADDFVLELTAEDAGESGIEGDGATVIDANIVIQGLKVVMNSIMMGSGKTISVRNAGASTTESDSASRGGALEYNGTKYMMNEISVKVGDKSSAVLNAADNDDTITVELAKGAKSVLVDAGDGLNTVNATIYGGTLDIRTGEGTDTVNLDIEGGDSVRVSTGDSYDELNIINNGAPAVSEIDAGDGDDVISLDMRAGAGNMTVKTGGGGDTLSILKGDHYTIETLDYSISKDTTEKTNPRSESVLTIENGDANAVDRATVDAAVGDAIKGITFTGGKGASVHLKGSLKDGATDPITQKQNADKTTTLILAIDSQDTSTLEITSDLTKTNFTDALKNKRTVVLDESNAKTDTLAPGKDEAAQGSSDKRRIYFDNVTDAFTNYVVRMPVSNLGSIRIAGATSPLLLTNIVLDTDETMDEEEHLQVNRLIAENVNVLLKGETIDINGTVKAQNVRAESVRGSHLFSELLERVLAGDIDGGMEMFSLSNEVNINFNEGADVRTANDIAALARVKHMGGILTILPSSVNLLNIKVADAHVNIKNGAKLNAGGSVDMQAKIETTIGYEYEYNKDGSVESQKLDGMPVAATFVFDNAEVTVEESAVVNAAEDVLLRASSDVKTLTYADSGMLDSKGLSFGGALGLTVISNSVHTTVAGSVTAGRKVYLSASGTVSDDTNASRTSRSVATSGGYIAVNVVDQDVSAVLESTAKVAAGGDVSVNSIAMADLTTSALAAAGKQKGEGGPDVGGAGLNLLKGIGNGILSITVFPLWKLASNYLKTTSFGRSIAEKSATKKLDKLMNSVAGGSYTAKVITPDRGNAKKGSATVTTEETANEHNEELKVLKATVTVAPVAGCTVDRVRYRYLEAGASDYTWRTAEKVEGEDNKYTFSMPNANVEVVVTWTGEPNGADENNNNNNNNENNNNNDQNDGGDDINLGKLFDQGDEIIQKDADEEDALYSFNQDDYEGRDSYRMTYKFTEYGSVVTWLSGTDDKRLSTVYAGQKVLFVPNPLESKEIKTLTVSYTVTLENTGERVTKTENVAKDDQGRYIFTVPDNLEANSQLEVNATFGDKTDDSNAGDISHNQVTGAVAVGVLINDNSALIESGAVVEAGGEVSLFGLKHSVNQTTADGTNVDKDYSNSSSGSGSGDAVSYTTKTKYTVTGAQYAVLVDSNIPGAVKSTMDRNQDATTYFPKFTIDKSYEGKIQKVYLTYYTKLSTSLTKGIRKTVELKAAGKDANGNIIYQPALTDYAVMDGTVVRISFVFNEDAKEAAQRAAEADDSASSGTTANTTALVRNPIAISVNAIAEKDEASSQVSTKSIGEVYFVKEEDGKYYFNVVPDEWEGYTINPKGKNYDTDRKSDTSVLYASWRDTAGRLQTAPLNYEGTYWVFAPSGGGLSIPMGNEITINAVFSEDTRSIVAQDVDEDKGSVSFSKSSAKAKDEVTVTVKSEKGYYPSSITVKWYGQSAKGALIEEHTDTYTVDASGKATITMPKLADNASLRITPVFTEKTITLTAKGTQKDTGHTSGDYITLSETSGKVAAGQSITVSASDSAKKDGYHVTEVHLTYNGEQHTFEEGATIRIPENVDVNLVDIAATLVKGAVEVPTYTDATGLGSISSVYGWVDAGETVQVRISPKEGYRAKSGTVKATVRTTSGIETIVLSHTGENQYSFTMPLETNGARIQSVTLTGMFEEGDDGVAMSLGASAAVGVTLAHNDVQIEGGTITAGTGVSLFGVSIGGKATTEAKAGYSKGKTGFAGGVAVQVATVQTDVGIKKDENGSVTIKNGGLFLSGVTKQTLTVTGDASGKKGSEATGTGVGAGLAVAVHNVRATAEVEDGVTLGTGTNLTSVTATSTLKTKTVLGAVAGAKGGTAVVPVAAVEVSSLTSRAKLGKLKNVPNDVLRVDGKVKIKSSASSAKAAWNHAITADASAVSKGSALGGAFIVTWIDTDSDAILNQSVNAAKDITVSSSADDSVRAIAKAAVTGGMQGSANSGGGAADRQANGLLNGAANIAGNNGMDANRIRNAANNRQNAENSDSTVAAAGAFVLNMQSVHSKAEVKDGVDVTTAGKLSVTSANRTDATIKADASATESKTGVGVGIAINVVNMENIARIGDGGVTANELELTAQIAAAPVNCRVLSKVEGVDKFREQLTDLLKRKLAELMGVDQDNYFAEVLSGAAAAAVDELVKKLKMEKLFAFSADSLDEQFLTPIKLIADRLIAYPQVLINPLMTVVDEISDTIENFDGKRFLELLKNQVTVQLAGNAAEIVKGIINDNKMLLAASVMNMIGDGLGGKGWSGSTLTTQLKGIAKKALIDFATKMLEDTITKFSSEVSVLTDNNVGMIKRAWKRLTTEGDMVGSAVDYAVDTFRDQVYDYEALMVEIGETGLRDFLKDTLMSSIKASGVTMVNQSIDALMGKLDVKVAKEPTNDRHVITTQAISGAGAAETSGAGSLAIAVANLTTTAEIASGNKAVTIAGETTIDAEELRRIRTHATAAVDEDGEADNNTSEGTAEESSIGGGGDSEESATSIEGKDEHDNTCTVSATAGGDLAFDDKKGVNKVWLTPAKGYKLSEGAKATRTYRDEAGEETTEELDIQKSADGKYYIEPYSGELPNREVWGYNMQVKVTFEEDLHTIPTPTAEAAVGMQVEDGAVTVKVEGRTASDGTIQARANEVVELTIKKQDGQTIDSVVLVYTDANGNRQQQNKVVPLNFGAASGRTYSNKDEEGYAFLMPDGDIQSITVLYAKNNDDGDDEDEEENENVVRDAAGRSIGVGAAFALTYGNSDVKAQIGERSAGVTAGTLTVNAYSEHDEENYATAGTEPFDGTDEEAEKKTAIDASVSVNILDNDIRAGIASGTPVEVTGAGSVANPENTMLGALSVTAEEASSSATKASSFATGSSTIVGAAVSVNLSLSDVKAELGSGATAAADVTVTADSSSEDETWAFATALGSDVQRVLNKVANGTKAVEDSANKLTSGAYFDEMSDKWKSSGKKTENRTADRINQRVDQNRADGVEDNAAGNLNLSTNLLRSQNVQQNNGNQADDAVGEARERIQQDGGQDIVNQANPNEANKKLQVAAAVGVMVTNHKAAVTVGDVITSGGAVELAASNDGNFNTRSTGAAMSLERRSSGSTIAAAVGVSVNNNQATVDVTGGIDAQDDVTVSSVMKQNQSDEFIKRVAVQSISGAVSGQGTDNSIAGAVSVLVSNAKSTVDVKGKDSSRDWSLKGAKVTVSADDKSKLGIRAGGVNVSTGASTGGGLSSAVLVSSNTVRALVGDHANIRAAQFALTAEKTPVTWEDAVSPYSWSDLVTDTSNLNDEQRENVYTGIIDVHRKPGEQSYTVDVNLDSHNIMKAFDALNILAYKNYYVEAIAGSLAVKNNSKLNGAGSVAVATTKNTVETVLGSNVTLDVSKDHAPAKNQTAETAASDADSEEEEDPDGSVTIMADGSSTARVISGAISGGKSKSGLGITISYFGNSDAVKTTIGDNLKLAGSSVKVGTKADADIESYNAAASIATGNETTLALGGAVDVITMSNKAKTEIGQSASIRAKEGDLSVTSQADMDLMLVSAAVAGSGKGVAAGGSATVIVSGTASEVVVGKNHLLEAEGDLTVSGKTTERMVSVSGSASAAFDAEKKPSVAGSINVMVSKSKGNVDLKASDAGAYGLVSNSGSVSVLGEVKTGAVNVTAALTGSKGTAIGFSANGNWFEREAKALIGGGSGYVIRAGRDVLHSAYAEDTTVLAGLAAAGSVKGSSISGNLQLTRSANTVHSTIGKAQITAGGEAAFASRVNDHTYSIAGSVALSNDENAIGATAVILLKDNSILTDLGASTVTAGGSAGTLKEKLNGAPDFSGVYVGATQKDVTVTVGAGVALANELGVAGNLAFVKNASTVKADSAKAAVTASTGSIRQEAAADTLEWVVAGGLGIGKTTGAGASASGIYAQKKVDALAGRLQAAQNVKVSADNTDKIINLALSAGGGKLIAVQLGAAITVLGSKVHAISYGDTTAEKGSVAVTAKNDTNLTGVAVSAAVSNSSAFAPVGAVMVFNGETESGVYGKVTAAQEILIRATADKAIDQYTVGLSLPLKGFGISGAINIVKTEDTVLAHAASGSTLLTGGDITIDASGDYTAHAASAALTFSKDPNAAVNAMVHLLKSKVEAELAGNVGSSTVKAGNVSVTADSDRDVIDVGASVAGTIGLVGAGATVMVLAAGDEKLSQDAADTLVYGSSETKKEDDKSFDLEKYLKKAEDQGLDVSALSGLSNDLKGDGVKNSDTKMDTVGDVLDAASEEKITVPTRPATTPKDMVMARITADSTVYTDKNVTVRALQPTKADLYGADVSLAIGSGAAIGATVAVANLHSNVSASSMGSLHMNGGKVTVDASSTAADVDVSKSEDEQTRMTHFTGSLKSDNDNLLKTLDPTRRSIRVVGLAVSGSKFALGAAVGVLNTDNVTNAVLGGEIRDVGETSVHADSIYDNVVTAVLNASLGVTGASAGAAVAYTGAQGETTARMDSSTRLQNTKIAPKVSVTTDAVMNVTSVAAAAAGGGYGGVNAGVSYVDNSLKQTTTIDPGAVIRSNSTAATAVDVHATSNTNADTWLLTAQVNLIGQLQAGVSMSHLKPTIVTGIGKAGSDLTTLTLAGADVNVGNTVKSRSSAGAVTLSGAAVSLNGAFLRTVNHTDAVAQIANVNMRANSINVDSALDVTGDATTANVNVGLLSGAIANTKVDLEAKNLSSIDSTGGRIQTAKGIKVTTGDKDTSKSSAKADSFSLDIGVATLGMNYAKAVNNTTNIAQLTGSGTITTSGGDVEVQAYSDATAKTNVKPWTVSAVNLKVDDQATGKAVNKATSLADVTMTGSLQSNLKVRSDMDADTTASVMGGGMSGIEGLNVAALANGETQSLINVDLANAGTAKNKVNIDVQNNASDTVKADLGMYNPVNVVSVAVLKTDAESKDNFNTQVRLGSGKFYLEDLNVVTDYDTKADSVMDAAKLKFQLSVYQHRGNDAIAKNESYAGTTVTLDKATVTTTGDVNVKTHGTAEANAEVGNANFSFNAVSTGSSTSDAQLTAVQAAALNMVDGSLTAGGDLNVVSDYDKAEATAKTGTLAGKEVKMSTVAVTPYKAYATEKLSSTASVQGSGALRSRISADNVQVYSGAEVEYVEVEKEKEGSEEKEKVLERQVKQISKAEATARGSVDIDLISAGNMESGSTVAEKVYTTVDGVGITAGGTAQIDSAANTKSTGKIIVPKFSLSMISDFRDMEANADIGADKDRQTVQTLIGDSTSITAKGAGEALRISASNVGAAATELEKGAVNILVSAMDYEERTHAYFDTGVQIGRNASLTAQEGSMDITSHTAPTAKSNIDGWDKALLASTTDNLGHITIRETNALSIGDNTSLEAKGDLNVKADTSANSVAVADYSGMALGAAVNKVYAKNDISRAVDVTVGRGASLTSKEGGIAVESVSGEEDHIITKAKISGVAVINSDPMSYADTYLTSSNTVRVGDRATISAAKDVNLTATATSVKDSDYGIYNEAVTKGGSAFPFPDADSTIKLNLDSLVYVNRGRSTGDATVKSTDGIVKLVASNEGMRVRGYSNADNDGGAGESEATTKITGNVFNQVWTDNTNYAGKEVTFLATNGEKEKPLIYSNSYAEFYGGPGYGDSVAQIDGTWSNYVSTYDKTQVSAAGSFTHIAEDPSTAVDFKVQADANAWIKEYKNNNDYHKSAYHCDFCADPTQEQDKNSRKTVNQDEVKSTEYVNGKVSDQKVYENLTERLSSSLKASTAAANTLDAAFKKALVSLAEVRRLSDTANQGTGVTKARYGEEDTRTAAKVFALDVTSLLKKDVRLDGGVLGKYRMWINSATQLAVYLLPNASRLAMGPGMQLQYVADTLQGDALGDGNTYEVDVITALTQRAFQNPVVGIGSGGSLDFSNGTLEIPAGSDLDLYLHEISAAWLLEQLESGALCTLCAPQADIDACVLAESSLPAGEIAEGVTPAGRIAAKAGKDEIVTIWDLYWAGYTPDNAPDVDTPLYCLLVNPDTDEVDAYRTSRAMIARGERAVDVSLYMFRDSKADRMGEVKYDAMFFDTPDDTWSLVKAVSGLLGEKRTEEVPHTLRIVLRIFHLDGADLPAYSISGHLFAMNDGTDGVVSMFGGFYLATFDGDVFESDYLKVEGIRDGNPSFTIKANQPVWPEWTSSNAAEDLAGARYVLTEDGWTAADPGIGKAA